MLPRFLAKVKHNPATDCYLWTAFTDRDGYGRYNLNRNHQRMAHRISYLYFVGPIPDGTVIDHDCHTRDRTCPGGPTCLHRRCVNPHHLVALPERINILLGRGLAAQQAQQTHCHRGHPISGPGADVRVYGNRRYCRPCRRIWAAEQRTKARQVIQGEAA